MATRGCGLGKRLTKKRLERTVWGDENVLHLDSGLGYMAV